MVVVVVVVLMIIAMVMIVTRLMTVIDDADDDDNDPISGPRSEARSGGPVSTSTPWRSFMLLPPMKRKGPSSRRW